MPKDVLFEELFMVLLEDQVALQFLLEHGLYQKDPYLLDADDSLPDACVVLDYRIE